MAALKEVYPTQTYAGSETGSHDLTGFDTQFQNTEQDSYFFDEFPTEDCEDSISTIRAGVRFRCKGRDGTKLKLSLAQALERAWKGMYHRMAPEKLKGPITYFRYRYHC